MNITVETTVHAPIDKVWTAYTTPDDIVQWNAASDDWHTTSASVELRVGDSFLRAWKPKMAVLDLILQGPIPRLFPMNALSTNLETALLQLNLFKQTRV